MGFGVINIKLSTKKKEMFDVVYRAILLSGERFEVESDWQPIIITQSENFFVGEIILKAGGWYNLEFLIQFHNDTEKEKISVGPVGIGEVYIIAGQSYASLCHDGLTTIEDIEGRVTVFDLTAWRVAHDPLPLVPNQGYCLNHWEKQAEYFTNGRVFSGGSVWPTALNLLLPIIKVPIGIVNVSIDSTPIESWLPDKSLFNILVESCKKVGSYRAILWQHGESDVMVNTEKEIYKQRLIMIKDSLEEKLQIKRDWILAKSTIHPTVYSKPQQEMEIRSAINDLWYTDGFFPGPDTDVLDGENRASKLHSRHFSIIGQKRAGAMWFAALWNHLCIKPNFPESGVTDINYEKPIVTLNTIS